MTDWNEAEGRHLLIVGALDRMDRISDERLQELYEFFAEQAAMENCGVKRDIDTAKTLRELIERRASSPEH